MRPFKSYDGNNLLPVFVKFTRASPAPSRPAWGPPPPYTWDPRYSRDPEEGNNEEICPRGPASSGASGSTAFDPDPLTPQPEVTVPQAGTGHFRLRRKLREMLGGEAGYDNVTLAV